VVDQAAEQLEKSIAQEPDNARHYAFLTNLYLTAASMDPSYADKNLKIIERGIALSPTRTPFYYSLGRVYITKKLYDQAIDTFKKAVELSPNVPDAHLNLLAAYITANKLQEATTETNVIRGLKATMSPDNYATFSRVLRVGGAIPEAIKVLQEAIDHYPEEAGLYSELSNLYQSINDKPHALEYATKAAAIDPQYAPLLDQLKSGKTQ
jgi:superkiller protein 3